MTTVSKMGPTIAVESAKAQGSKAKPTSRVRVTQSNQSEARSDTKGGQQLVHPEPHQGDPTSSSFVSVSRPRGFLQAPLCGLAPSRLGFLARDNLRKMLETTWSRFDGGGHWPLSGPMERHFTWLALTHEWRPGIHSDPNSALQCSVLDR
jgi:hypothetical protein